MLSVVDLLRHLSFFTAVADTRHFGHAAQDLGMTQPPLSQGIQRLERHLGVRLFDRDARGVRTTSAGQQLLGPARDVLRAADDFRRDVQHLSLPTQARLGLCGDLGPIIPGLCRHLIAVGAEAVPEIAGSTTLVNRIHDGLLDVAVIRHPGVVDGLEAGNVFRLTQRLLTADGPSSALLRSIVQPLVVPPRHHHPPAHDQFVDALRRAGHTGDVLESSDPAQRDALVAADRAASVSPATEETGEDPDVPPLRVRIVLPPVRSRRLEVDHSAVMTALNQALSQ